MENKKVKTKVHIKTKRLINFASMASPTMNAWIQGDISAEIACGYLIGLAKGMCNEDIGNLKDEELKHQMNTYLAFVKRVLEHFGKVGEMKMVEKEYRKVKCDDGSEVEGKIVEIIKDLADGKSGALRV